MALRVGDALQKTALVRKARNSWSAPEDGPQKDCENIVYLTPGLVQCGFPHSRQGGLTWYRRNGGCHLTLMAHPETGLPYGSLPRLLLMFWTRQALRKKSRRIDLDQISPFMRSLGMRVTGGAKGSIARVRRQVEATLRTRIEIKLEGRARYEIRNSQFFDGGLIWTGREGGYLEMSEAFFNAIIESAVPYDLEVLRRLQTSPLALDLYCWASWRSSLLKHSKATRPVEVLFDALHGPEGQTGAMYLGYDSRPGVRSRFIAAVRHTVRRINMADEGLRLSTGADKLIVYASPPRVARGG